MSYVRTLDKTVSTIRFRYAKLEHSCSEMSRKNWVRHYLFLYCQMLITHPLLRHLFRWLTKVKREPENTFDLTVATQPEPLTAEEKLDEAIIKEEEGISMRRSNRGLTVEDRKHILEADRRVKRVERHQVQCALCDREVKLHNFRSYELWNWTQHAKKCEARLARRAGPLSDATTNGTTLVDETTVESDTEVEAALVAPSPSVQTPEEESSHYRK